MIAVTGRAMIDRADIEWVVKEIDEAAKVESVVLFGSYAAGFVSQALQEGEPVYAR